MGAELDGTYEPEVGDLLRRADGRTCLVGDVNANGGGCDDCYSAPWTVHHRLVDVDPDTGRGHLRIWCTLDEGWRYEGNVMRELCE